MRRLSAEWLVPFYIAVYIPYVVLTRWLASTILPGFSAPLTGLEIVPSTVLMSWLMMVIFAFSSGWRKYAHQFSVGTLRLPHPTRWTILSGCAAGLILVTVPLSFTFKSVSIPFVQLMLRGDILIIAPMVDLLSRRRVHWRSWLALGLTACGAAAAVSARGGFHLPTLCWVTIVLYAIGYLLRLAVMTRVAKSGAPGEAERYYVEEQMVASPFALAILAVLALTNSGGPAAAIRTGFWDVWHSSALPYLAGAAMPIFGASVLGVLILVNKRENSYCVPLERSGSILAGVAGSLILALEFGQRMPGNADFFGAGLLVLAICVLATGPRQASRG